MFELRTLGQVRLRRSLGIPGGEFPISDALPGPGPMPGPGDLGPPPGPGPAPGPAPAPAPAPAPGPQQQPQIPTQPLYYGVEANCILDEQKSNQEGTDVYVCRPLVTRRTFPVIPVRRATFL